MNGWLIYWITRLDALGDTFVPLLTILCVAGILGSSIAEYYKKDRESTYTSEDNADASRLLVKAIRRIIFIVIAGVSLCALLPSTKEACAIYLIPKIANNEEVQKIPQNALKLLNAKCEEWIGDVTGDDK